VVEKYQKTDAQWQILCFLRILWTKWAKKSIFQLRNTRNDAKTRALRSFFTTRCRWSSRSTRSF
jgi:hypothetical protein